MFIKGMDAFRNHVAFAQSQAAHIETEVYKIEYPDIQYPGLAFIDTSANPFAEQVTYYSMDGVGEAEFLANRANDFPLVATQREQHNVRIENLGIGYEWDLFEINTAMMLNQNLRGEKAEIAFRVHQEKIDSIFLYGHSAMGWDGLLNSSAVTASDAAATGQNSSMKWEDKNAAQIVEDVNNALNAIVEESMQVEMADTILLPVKMLNLLATRRYVDDVDGLNMTILEWIKRHNVYTATTGRELTIRTVRGLENAGGSNAGRMIAYPNNNRVLKFHLPMPLRWLPVQQWLQRFIVAGIFRLGGLEIRRPKAMRYVDGIMD